MVDLLIVDDEERARNGIKTLIDWEEHNISIVGEARDGAEALELLESRHVDILLTDIRMPEMDGLQLIDNVKRRFPHIKSVIMSGYDDFNYAKKALTLGASNYLLKPSRRQEILDTVLKLSGEIAAEREQSRHMERLKEGFRESLPLMRDKALSRLMSSEDAPYTKLLGNLKLSGLVFPYPYFGVVRVQIDDYLQHQNRFGTFDFELLKYGLKNICEETLSEVGICAAVEDQDDITVILNVERETPVSSLKPLAEKLIANADAYLHLSLSVAIGPADKGINQLRTAGQLAANALDTAFYLGHGKLIHYEEALEEEPLKTAYPIELERLILQSVLSGDEGHITSGLTLFQKSLDHEKQSKPLVLKFAFALYFALYRLCIEKELDVNTIFGQDLEEITKKLAKLNIDSIYAELLNTALCIGRQLNEKKQSNKLFESILDYIREHYNQDISRETVAKEVFITPGYLSLLFKQQLRSSFLDFLHKVRMEQACLLLKDQSLRIADIALQVGYNDEKYFFQVFKKYMGMTPKQFRNTIKS
ncbi:response regulator transcription factor [Paenibacillus sp. CAU 1782]